MELEFNETRQDDWGRECSLCLDDSACVEVCVGSISLDNEAVIGAESTT